ncbi:sulfite exporter TauE/SafE family protein [Saccharopolyspora hirsuta]|uniref:Probable membrane transporter protein n=1 Tax=Saccharopolyspora hirsuta TaxID=1837 RepID=A0A5M7BG94_SACHI|nr:sulfite exporter TauE/SafE family protein [Saccharopolyspora hirsuta]KAA5828422.1 sulfite exporter TauE/SafE family protein [Saccharopolyspora hirsuta]
MILAVVFGVVIGLSTGLLGAGGSILAVPALVYGVGQPMSTAVPTALVVVAASAIGGLCSRNRLQLVQWPVALVFGVAGIPGAIGGAALGRSLPQDWLLLGFAVLMTVVAVRMFRGGKEHSGACRTPDGEIDHQRCLPRTAAAGSGVGVLTGLFGVGGGFVVVPALSILLGLTAPQAIANSMVVIAINSISGLFAHAGAAAQLDIGVLLAFAATAMLVSVAAARFSERLPASTVRRAFAWAVLAVAAGVGISSAIGLATA